MADEKELQAEREALMKKMLEDLKASFEALPYPVLYTEDEVDAYEKMLPAEDGVGLRTIFYIPKEKKAYPVTVQRSCYPMQEGMSRIIAMEYARRGFGYVLQFCRGTGGSEGVWEPNVNDRSDGLSLLNWLNDQDFVESLGYQGGSYLAFTGWIMADAVPEKVKAMYLTVYGTDRHTSAYKDGLFRQDILTAWAMGNAGRVITADYLKSAAYRPQIKVDEAMWGGELSWYRDWISNTSRTDEYWKEGLWKMLREIPSKVKIPIYIVEGWYDHHLGSALKGYESLNEETKAHTILKIGPWNHSFQPAITGHPEQKNGFSTGNADMFKWFYDILVKKETPQREVDWYIIGSDTWETFPEYPVVTDKNCKFYLGAEGTLKEAPEEDGCRTYTYDPEDPVMSHGAESLFASQPEIGSLKQPEPDFRPDVISFVSDPVKEDITIIGKPQVKLFVSSTAEDTCFTWKLMEVFENGDAYNIRNGITTLAYRNGSPDRITYTPGQTEEVLIEAWDVAWTVKKGSRIRLDISSSNFPEYSVHPNKAGIWSMIEETEKAEQTVFFGKDQPSCLILPVK